MPGAQQQPNGLWRPWWRVEGKMTWSSERFTAQSTGRTFAFAEQAKVDTAKKARREGKGTEMTYGEWAAIWMDQRRGRVEESTYYDDTCSMRANVLPRWKDVPMLEIDLPTVAAWAQQLVLEKNAVATARKIYALFRRSLNQAALSPDVKYDRSLPAGIQLDWPALPKQSGRAFTTAELDEILEYTREPYRSVYTALAYLGLRFGELAGLHWSQVNEEKNRITVADCLVNVSRVIKPVPKGKRERWVRIPDPVVAILNRPDDWEKPCGLIHRDKTGKITRCSGSLVFPGPQGSPLDPGNTRLRHWLPALKAAGFDCGRQHDLRHCYITWLLEEGVTATEVARAAGHSSTYVTERYSHVGPSYGQASVEALNRVSRRSKAG